MRRADRLFRIVEFLKSRTQVVTAETLSYELEVSKRTIYRDIHDLYLSGVPIEGEAGVGYTLRKDYIVKPLMFEIEEIEALLLGAQMVSTWGDKALSNAANVAINKMLSSIPTSLKETLVDTYLFSFTPKNTPDIHIDFTALRRSIRKKYKIQFNYKKPDGEKSNRIVRPLALVCFAPTWLLLGWCESKQDFRNFRVDRMSSLKILNNSFRDEQGKRLQDYKDTLE